MIENSMLDLIVVSQESEQPNQIQAIYNNLQGSSFFIKARMLTDQVIGSPLRSVNFKCVLTSLQDHKFIVQGSDTGQSTYGALQVPNTMIGVGRSNNFIELFTVATFANGVRNMREWSPIIPKSVLYIYSDQEASGWTLKLLVNPTTKVNLILVVDALILMVLSLIVIVLYLKEKVDDEKEKGDTFNYF